MCSQVLEILTWLSLGPYHPFLWLSAEVLGVVLAQLLQTYGNPLIGFSGVRSVGLTLRSRSFGLRGSSDSLRPCALPFRTHNTSHL